MSAITAHGKTYRTHLEATARIDELEQDDLVHGASDGRVTEITLIREALDAAAAARDNAKEAAWRGQQISDATRDLAYLRASGQTKTEADHRIEYEDGTHRRISYYTTEEGFLKALIRMHSRPGRFTVINVD